MSNFAAKYGRTALITGASSGIGAEFARQLAEAGFDLVLVARRRDRLEALAAELQSRAGIRATVAAVDLGAPGAVDELVMRTVDLDIGLVVAAAGTMVVGTFTDNDYRAETATTQLNAMALMQLAHHYGNRMVHRGGGALILVSSTVGAFATPYSANYAATKAYVSILGRALHYELKPSNVDVLTLAPGPTNTEGLFEAEGIDFTSLPMPRMSAAAVVRIALKKLGRRSLVTPGPLNRFTDFLGTRVLGRRVTTTLFGFMMAKALRPVANPVTPTIGEQAS